MKLYYFDFVARAETARCLLKVSGVEFEDVRFSPQEWGANYKAMSPSGQCPFIELEDGTKITQTAAVNMYCAGKAGLLPTEPYQLVRTVELHASLEEVFKILGETFKLGSSEEKVEAVKKLTAPDGAMYKMTCVVDKLIGSKTTAFFCGDEPTLADYLLYTGLAFFRSGSIEGGVKEFIDSFPNINELRTKVASLPKVKEVYGPTPPSGLEA